MNEKRGKYLYIYNIYKNDKQFSIFGIYIWMDYGGKRRVPEKNMSLKQSILRLSRDCLNFV